MKNFIKKILLSRLFQAAVAALLLYTVIGFFIIPALAGWYIPSFWEKQTGFPAQIGKVRINPFLLTFEAGDFKIMGGDGRPVTGFGRLFLDFKPSGLFRKTVRLGRLVLENPAVNMVVEPNGSVSLTGIPNGKGAEELPEKTEAPASEGVRVIVDSFSLAGGEFTITDKRGSSPAVLTLRDISVESGNFSTIQDRTGNFSISARTENGEAVELKGELCLAPFKSTGHFSFSAIGAETPWIFARDNLNLQAVQGKLDLSGNYQIGAGGSDVEVVIDNFQALLSGALAKIHGEEQAFFELGRFGIESAKLDLASKSVEIGKVLVDGARLRLHAGENGELNTARVIRTSASGAKDRPKKHGAPVVDKSLAHDTGADEHSKPETGDWRVKIGLIELRDTTSEMRFDGPAAPGPFFGAKLLALESAEIDLAGRTLAVSRIRLDGARLDAGIDKDGRLDVTRIAGQGNRAGITTVETGAPETAPAGPGWKFLIKDFQLTNSQSAFTDYRFYEKPLYSLRDLSVGISPIDGKSPMNFKAGFAVEQGGKVTIEGNIDPSLPSVNAGVKVERLVLNPVRPYLSSFITLELESAAFSTEGTFRYGLPGVGQKISYEGALAIDNLRLVQAGASDKYWGWGSMKADGLKLAIEPNKVSIERITLTKPIGELIIAEDKSVNLTKLLKSQAPPEAAGARQEAPLRQTSQKTAVPAAGRTGTDEDPGNSFPFSIGAIQVQEANMLFADFSLQPRFMTRIHDLKGTITGLSSEKEHLSRIALEGSVDRYGSARINGTLDPGDYKRSTDIEITFRNLEMSGITPYSGKFAGRTIKSGKLSMDLKYRIEGSKLVGDNKIIVEKLVLGEHVNSPDAVNLPLDLAVALLSDSGGRIDIGLPVSGDLADPQFSIAPLVWKAFSALITKAATAPFRAIGALLGGSDKEGIDSVVFDPGRSDLQPPEKEKIKNLLEALTKKPLLKVQVQGRYSPQSDGTALGVRAVRRAVAARAGIKKNFNDGVDLDFEDSGVRNALEAMFSEKFGKKALNDLNEAVKKGEIKPEETSDENSKREKSKKRGIISRAVKATRVYKIIPGMKSPDQSKIFAAEMFVRLVKSETIPEKELLDLAKSREQAVFAEIAKLGVIGEDRFKAKDPEASPGEEGLSAKLSLDSI